MTPGFRVSFVLLTGLNAAEDLIRALGSALHGERPIQADYPDADCYIEGSVQWEGDDVRVTLMLCAMDDHVVVRSYRQQFPVSRGDYEIGLEVAEQFLTPGVLSGRSRIIVIG